MTRKLGYKTLFDMVTAAEVDRRQLGLIIGSDEVNNNQEVPNGSVNLAADEVDDGTTDPVPQ
jgi:hypothetical protein